MPAAGDVNHVQLVHGDAVAYVSSRLTNAIYKVDVAAGGTTVWVCGGEHGEFELVDAGGTRYPKGYSLWHGQHNAEYFGEYVNAAGALVHQVMMFDNQYEQGASSRMLVVEIDEAALVATVVWEWSVGAYTKVGERERERAPRAAARGQARARRRRRRRGRASRAPRARLRRARVA